MHGKVGLARGRHLPEACKGGVELASDKLIFGHRRIVTRRVDADGQEALAELRHAPQVGVLHFVIEALKALIHQSHSRRRMLSADVQRLLNGTAQTRNVPGESVADAVGTQLVDRRVERLGAIAQVVVELPHAGGRLCKAGPPPSHVSLIKGFHDGPVNAMDAMLEERLTKLVGILVDARVCTGC